MTAERRHLGDALVKEALAPLRHASARLGEGAIEEALAALSRTDLEAALHKGVGEAAKLFGVAPKDIEAEIPRDAFREAFEGLEARRREALEASQRQKATAGFSIADPDSVGDGRKRTCAEAIVHAARKFVKDKPLAEKLEALGAEVSTYQALLSQCGDKLDASPLHGRTERRKFVAIAALFVVVAGALSAGGYVWWSKKKVADARARVEAALSADDPCAVEQIAAEDFSFATPEQIAREQAELSVCAKQRQREGYESACEALAKDFAAGKLSPEDVEVAKDTAPRLTRAVKKELTADDLLATPKDMPCQDSKAKDRFFKTYAAHAAASTGAWSVATKVSSELGEALRAKDFSGGTAHIRELEKRAEPLAARAILSGKPEVIEQARALCEFQSSFGGELGGKCRGLLGFLASRANKKR